jgi:hypothetical protein
VSQVRWFRITAVDSANRESPPSASVSPTACNEVCHPAVSHLRRSGPKSFLVPGVAATKRGVALATFSGTSGRACLRFEETSKVKKRGTARSPVTNATFTFVGGSAEAAQLLGRCRRSAPCSPTEGMTRSPGQALGREDAPAEPVTAAARAAAVPRSG